MTRNVSDTFNNLQWYFFPQDHLFNVFTNIFTSTLLEKVSTTGVSLFAVEVNATGISFSYGVVDTNTLKSYFDVAIAYQKWTHIALQVIF